MQEVNKLAIHSFVEKEVIMPSNVSPWNQHSQKKCFSNNWFISTKTFSKNNILRHFLKKCENKIFFLNAPFPTFF